MQAKRYPLPTILAAIGLSTSLSVISGEFDEITEARGKYLVKIAGCNDCHTSGYAPSGATTPESQWLAGDGIGFRGPWGTTYASNLRDYVGAISEDEWSAKTKTLKTRPPMPWWALNQMSDEDLRAVYRYIKSLGPLKNPVPPYIPPDQEPKTPVIQWPGQPE